MGCLYFRLTSESPTLLNCSYEPLLAQRSFFFFHPAEEPTWVLLTAPATEADQGAAHQWSLYCRLAATEATCNNQMSSDLRGTKPAPIGTTIPGQCTREVGQLGGLDGFIIKSNMPQNKTLVSLMKIKADH